MIHEDSTAHENDCMQRIDINIICFSRIYVNNNYLILLNFCCNMAMRNRVRHSVSNNEILLKMERTVKIYHESVWTTGIHQEGLWQFTGWGDRISDSHLRHVPSTASRSIRLNWSSKPICSSAHDSLLKTSSAIVGIVHPSNIRDCRFVVRCFWIPAD